MYICKFTDSVVMRRFSALHPSLPQLNVTMNLTVNEMHSQRRQALSAHATGAEASENSICRFVIPGFNLCYYCPNKSNNGESAPPLSFLKFVIGTLFHKPAPETRNAPGYRREIGENSVENSCLRSGSYTYYRISESTFCCPPDARSLTISRASNYITCQ